MSLEYKHEESEESESSKERIDYQPIEIEPPYYTFVLLGCIIAVTITQFSTDLESSVLLAGFVKPDFLERHEYWRILTGGAMHASVSHIFFNGYALFSFGKLVEFLSNRAHLAIVFVLSVIGGGLLSVIFTPGGISVGASGGIVGLIGYLAVYGFRRKQLLSPEFLKSILINIAIIAGIGLLLYQVIDNFGHLGGLMAGLLYGFFQIPKDLHKNPREVGALTEGIGMVCLGIFVFTSVFAILLILQYIKL